MIVPNKAHLDNEQHHETVREILSKDYVHGKPVEKKASTTLEQDNNAMDNNNNKNNKIVDNNANNVDHRKHISAEVKNHNVNDKMTNANSDYSAHDMHMLSNTNTITKMSSSSSY